MAETMKKDFKSVGQTDTDYKIKSLKAAFFKGHFDICAIHNLKAYHENSPNKFYINYHCKNFSEISEKELSELKFYFTNLILCPEADTEFDVLAWMEMVWPSVKEEEKNIKGFLPRIKKALSILFRGK